MADADAKVATHSAFAIVCVKLGNHNKLILTRALLALILDLCKAA